MACQQCSAPCQGRLCKHHEIANAHEDDIGAQQRQINARSRRRARRRQEAEDD